MSKSRRAQILMEPERYDALEAISHREGLSVAELIRRAVDAYYFRENTGSVLSSIFGMGIPVPEDPDELCRDLGGSHDAHLS